MLEMVLRHIRNYFAVSVEAGPFEIKDGKLTAAKLLDGQHFRIVGSVFNDGVYQYPVYDLKDEKFYGAVWGLAIPRALLDTVTEIEAWQNKNGEAAQSPYTSESFGGYSYTKDKDAATGGAVTWESAFRSRLNVWRKL